MVLDLKFIHSINPTFEFNWHHKAQCQNIENWLVGGIKVKNLMILAPPRSGKTELHSKILPCYLDNILPPNKKVLHISHSENMANELRRNFQRINGKFNHENVIFSYVGCSLSSQFDYIIMDDLIKSISDAQSLDYQKKLYNWYNYDLLTRLNYNGKQLMVASHYPNDIPSKIISSNNSDWVVTKFPLFAIRSNLYRKEEEILWTKITPSVEIDNLSYTTLWQQEDPEEDIVIINY